jgi:photosystem II stability/assembly factor-like uncharacterized protein
LDKIVSRFGRQLLFIFLLFIASSVAAQSVSPDLYSGLKWRLIGPFRGGRAVAVTGVPGSATTFYFGAVNGGIWKTTDAGMVWTPIFDSQHVASIGAISVAPSDPKVIYAGTGEADIRSDLSSGDGVYKSIDAGQTWVNLGLHDSRQIARIAVDPRDANVVYVAALGHAYGPNSERGVYKSIDGGASWTKVLDQGPDVGAADLDIAMGNPQVIFAATWRARRPPWSTYAPLGGPGTGLYRSRDAGKTWARLTGNGLPGGEWNRTAVAVSTDGKRVYALIDGPKAGLYRSVDEGDTWTLQNSDKRITARSWYFGSITIDPQNPDVIYIPSVALYHSEDGGKTISVLRGAPGGDDYHQIWVDPQDSARMVLGTDQGTTISLDNGKTWSSWYNQPTAQLYHVITDDKFPYAVYGTQQDSGGLAVLSRTDHGQITPRDWFLADGSESGYIAPDPNDPNIFYVSGTYGTVSRFDLRTSFSQDITPWPFSAWNTEVSQHKYRDPWTPVLIFSPADKKTLYLGTQFLMKTTDSGLHWETISPDLTGSTRKPGDKKLEGLASRENAMQRGFGVVVTVAPSSLEGNLIWAGSDTGLIHITRDGGKTWNNVTPKGASTWSQVDFIEASHFDPAQAFAVVDRHQVDDQQPYFYRTRDYGVTWELITNGLSAPSFVRVVREDPQTRGLLFAGAERGIFVSFDDGDHWQSLQQNLPATSVQDLVVHGDDLVIATHGRSFWILDDITALRQAQKMNQAEVAWLFAPAKAIRVDNDLFLGTPLPPEEPTAENPPNGAILDYWLKGVAQHVSIEIFDTNQNLIRSFSSNDSREVKRSVVAIADRWFPKPEVIETTPGMHRLVWNFTWGDTHGKETVATDENSALRGPRVVPGTYQVRLTVDGKVLTQPLTVGMDPRSQVTSEELEQQLQLSRQFFAEALEARQVLSEVKGVQKQLSELEQKLPVHQGQIKSEVELLQVEIKRVLAGDESEPGSIAGLEQASTGLASALRVAESSDRTVPSQAAQVYHESQEAMKISVEEWSKIKADRLPQLNQRLQQANLPPIVAAVSSEEEEYSDTD